MAKVSTLPKLVYILRLLLPTGFLNPPLVHSLCVIVTVLPCNTYQVIWIKYVPCAQHSSK